jgi:LPXTG-motif cell wall-anchored protein
VLSAPASSCLAYGDGNFGQNDSTDAFLSMTAGAGYVLLDDTDSSDEGVFAASSPLQALDFVNGTATDTFTIGATPGYTSLALGLKDGNLGPIPMDAKLKWAVFLLGASSGTWEIRNADGTLRSALSHAVLYGKLCTPETCVTPPDPGTGEVPVPGAFMLMGTVLAGAGGIASWRRRRNRAAAG